jgi:MFS family permease
VALLAVDVGVGVALVALISALAARRTPRRGERVRALGWVLVGVPLPAAVCLHLAGVLSPNVDQIAFLGSVAAFAVGAALLLGGAAEDEDDWREGGDDSPPWWPEFERELRDYERDRLVRT